MARPNILLLLASGLSGVLFRDGPAEWLHAPALAALSGRARRFSRCYTASPLGGPARAALLTGCLPSQTGIFDDGAEFPASLPTLVHHLRRAGYRTALAGRFPLVGPDRLHGFEERLTPDEGRRDFGRTPDWREPAQVPPGLEDLGRKVRAAGAIDDDGTGGAPPEAAGQDAATALAAEAAIARFASNREPWFLLAAFAAPGSSYRAGARHWELYRECRHLAPTVGILEPHAHDPHSLRLLAAAGTGTLEPEAIARARRAYFSGVSWLDENLGRLLAALTSSGLAQSTIVMVTSDHGDMLGERGLWGPRTFREGAARVPMLLAGPAVPPGRVTHPVTLLDAAPTLAGLAGMEFGGDRPNLLATEGGPVPMEYLAEAALAPRVALVDGCWKYTVAHGDPPHLFDLANDSEETTNLARLAPRETARLAAEIDARWNRAALDRAVRLTQSRRHLIQAAHSRGRPPEWTAPPPPTAPDGAPWA